MEVALIGTSWSCNEWIAVEPPEEVSSKLTEESRERGFGVIEQKTKLITLKAVADCPSLGVVVGDSVYFRGDIATRPEAKQVFDFDGRKCVLLQKSLVVAVKR